MSRKSLANKVLGAQGVLSENDDEAERLVLRNNQEHSIILNNSSINRRQSLGLSCLVKIPEPQMKEHISHCIKLNAENKINMKNAFTLEMIDFITFMVRKKESDIPDLQVASVALDVCTKIYAYRVDGLYTDILKMAGGLGKMEENVENSAEKEELCNNEEIQLKSKSKKKRSNKQKICSTESALQGSIETSYPLQSIIGSGDSCALDMLYQAILPVHVNSGFYYHQYKDVILDTVDDIRTQEKGSLNCTISAIEECSHLDICQSFSDFKFLNYSHEDESEIIESNQVNNGTRFQFDLEASIPDMEEHESGPTDYFDIQEDENNVNQCMRNPEQVENIVDLRNIVMTQVPELDKPSEYSFIQKNLIHWAGPSYWKIKTFGKVLGNSKVVETCHQAPLKKKKAVYEYYDDIKSAVKQGFVLVKAAKIQYKTTPKSWKEARKTLPEDVHYNDSQLCRLYFYPSITLNHDQNEDQLNTIELSEHYCDDINSPNIEIPEGNDFGVLGSEEEEAIGNKVAFIGDNLIAPPKLTQKIIVPYAVRAKKIDMRQLKQSIWSNLTSSSNENQQNAEKAETENPKRVKESKAFNKVYKSLPTMLSKTNREALNVPVALVSLLHLANEKSLSLSSVPDFSDIIINEG